MESCFVYKKRVKEIALLLCIFLGFTGAHRFYTGSPGYGKFLLFTFGGFGILWFCDFMLLLGGNYHCGDGHYFV